MHDKKRPNHKEKERSYSRRLYTRSSKEKSKESDGNFKIKYINSQGLTKTKMIELEQLCKGKNELVLLSETHMKYNKININEKYSVINKMRPNDDKKGGGLQAFYRRYASFKMIEVENDNNDILVLLVEIESMKIYIILVYFSVQNNLNDKKRNVKMKNDLESLLSRLEGPILVIGDLNAHVQGLG